MDDIIEKLERIFEDVTDDDKTDPRSMDKVLRILEESRAEDDAYIELLVDKLQWAEITWEQPPYQMNYWLTRKPPPDEVALCDAGHFTKAEGKLVKKNWENFVQQYKVPDTPICLARWRNRVKTRNSKLNPKERVRKFVTAYLAQGLRRSLYQVNRYFITNYSYPVKLHSYTPTEEKIMDICFHHQPRNAGVILSEVLGREPCGINKRLSAYLNGEPKTREKIKWNLKLATELVHKLMEHAGCSFRKLKNNPFDQQVWLKVGKAMGCPRYQYVRDFWTTTLHVQLFAKCKIRCKTLRSIIFKKLRKSQYEIWTDIRWKDVAKEFPDGFTDKFLYKVTQNAFRGSTSYRSAPLRKLMAQAAEKNKKRPYDRRLKALRYHKSNGSITYTRHKVSVKELMKQMSINQRQN